MSLADTQPGLKLRILWLLIGYSLVSLVVFLSLTSSPVDTGLNFPYEDKLYHALAYFALMFWFGQIYHDAFKRNFIAVAFVFMGLLMEYLQSFDPARMAEFADMLANTSGVLIALLLSMTGAKNILLRLEAFIR